jgi:hypothetical protein
MKAKINYHQSDFRPFTLSITIETKSEFEILKRLVDLSANRAHEVVNKPFAEHAHFSSGEIKLVTDSIYYGLQESLKDI